MAEPLFDQRPQTAQAAAFRCEICGSERAALRWTDHHGIGACVTCGAPYRLYHYEGEGPDRRRVEKPPLLLILPEWLAPTRRYWEEMHRNCAPGAYNMPGSSYEVATAEDFETFEAWMTAHDHELPQE